MKIINKRVKTALGVLWIILFVVGLGMPLVQAADDLASALQDAAESASQRSSNSSEQTTTPLPSPMIIPLPYQTIEQAGVNRGLAKSFCEQKGMVSEPGRCANLGCYQEQVQINTNDAGLPSSVICYSCLSLISSQCCPGVPVVAIRDKGESCQAKTGVSCSETVSCQQTCPTSALPVPGVNTSQKVDCCLCSSIVEGKCDDKGESRSLSCGGGGAVDLRYEAADPNQCLNLVVQGGGRCLPKCIGEGIECGSVR